MWSAKTNIDFEEINTGEPDIWVKFVRQYHNDPYPFDGPGGTLAHAFYPHNNEGLSGDVHFDDDEYYTYKSSSGRNLLWVAVHEIGEYIAYIECIAFYLIILSLLLFVLSLPFIPQF